MKNIIIHEVGMRDGLQMEKQVVPMELKLKWIRAIMESGVDIIQIGSFVHPEKVPQMADTDKLFTELTKDNSRPENVVLSGLVLNEKGLERGFNCGVEMFCMGVSASETHSRKNTGMSVAEATDRIIAMAKQAEAEREKRAKIIHAQGELLASKALSEAAEIIAKNSLAIQLRYLQTLTEIATEKNSTIVFPLPIDLLSAFMKAKTEGK